MIELSALSENTCGWSFASKGMNNLFCNKFYTAGMLTAMIIILIMVLYPGKKGTPVFVVFKLAFYILICSYLVIFVRDGILNKKTTLETEGGKTDAFINALGGDDPVYGDNSITVTPAFSKGGDVLDNTVNDSSVATEDVFAMYGV